MTRGLYESDFYSWTQRQADMLRSGKLEKADLANIIEEIETLGRSEESSLESAYMLVSMHLLKAMFQPQMTTPSWGQTILHNRLEIAKILRKNPGLKAKREPLFAAAFADARKEAAEETGIDLGRFPDTPPFTREEAESEVYKPGRLGLSRAELSAQRRRKPGGTGIAD